MKLYFAHNFNNRNEFREIELQLEKELNIELFNPFYDDLTRIEEMNLLDKGEKFKEDKTYSEKVVRRDLKNLASCDGLLTIIKSPSIGTTLEIANARLMCKKYIIVISEKYSEHLWLKEYTTHRFKTIEEFKNFVKKNERT